MLPQEYFTRQLTSRPFVLHHASLRAQDFVLMPGDFFFWMPLVAAAVAGAVVPRVGDRVAWPV